MHFILCQSTLRILLHLFSYSQISSGIKNLIYFRVRRKKRRNKWITIKFLTRLNLLQTSRVCFDLWTLRLSKKIANSRFPNLSERSWMKAIKSSVFIDKGWSANASRPLSSLIAAIRAIVLIYASASVIVILEYFPAQALFLKVLNVNTASSIQTSFLSLSLVYLTAKNISLKRLK